MSAKKISQREAHALRRQVKALIEERRQMLSAWNSDYPGTQVAAVKMCDVPRELGKLEAARRLGFLIVAKLSGDDVIFRAVRGAS